MAAELLATKLQAPPPRVDAVDRPRITAGLDVAVEVARAVVLLSAPAGGGKTSALAAWAPSAPMPVAWLSLDGADNDPVRLVAYVVEALRGALGDPVLGASALGGVERRSAPDIAPILTALINELAALSAPIALVLDDHHTLDTPQALELLRFLVERQPDPLRLVLAGRSDPVLPLARLRLEGRLAELRVADLRFQGDETAALLSATAGTVLDPEAVSELERRTEGWPAGLQAAALALRGHEDPGAFVREFAGNHRFVLDYLLTEVVDRQAPAVREFLLCTAVLDRLCAPLCDALLDVERGTSDRMLQALERDNLFLLALDDRRHWYRYHRLFVELLRHRLRRQDAISVPELHRRAMRWHADQGSLSEAIGHGLSAEEHETVAGLVEHVAPAMILRKEGASLRGWIDALPEAFILARPRLCASRAWAALQTESITMARHWLAHAESAVAEGHGGHGDARGDDEGQEAIDARRADRWARGELAVLRASLAAMEGDTVGTLEHCREALYALPEEGREMRLLAAGARAGALHMRGQVARAAEAFADVVRAAEEAAEEALAVGSLCSLAEARKMQGRLEDAAQAANRAIDLASIPGRRVLPIAGRAHLILAAIHRERLEYQAAEQATERGLVLGRAGGSPSTQVIGHLQHAFNRWAEGDLASAQDSLASATTLARDWGTPGAVMVNFQMSEAALHLAQGDLEAAEAWAVEYSAERDALPPAVRAGDILLAEIRLTQGRVEEAEEIAVDATDDARVLGHVEREMRALVVAGSAAQARGDGAVATRRVGRALDLASPGGYLLPFARQGAALDGLLKRAAAAGHAPGLVQQILGQHGDDRAARRPSAGRTAGGANAETPIDALSEREVEVLRLVAAGLSNKEIAEELVIALGTVKRHLTNIHAKFGVSRRTQAVARGRELGLIG